MLVSTITNFVTDKNIYLDYFCKRSNVHLTPGNVDDRKPVNKLLQSLFGKVFADRGYVSQSLGEELLKDFGIEFFAKPKRNLKNRLIRLYDKLLSRKRSIVETINALLELSEIPDRIQILKPLVDK
ncbi:MAG: transposase [Microcystis sp. LE19-10.1B]|uniref:transposase n=2 Tax=Microcystis TaxID=1125 RepID=UPI0022BAD9A3|nr:MULTISPECIES: transposase [unclassified Microcystis]MCZ8028515.1 transposase [Microcystis sp. LE19-10.1B]MCZ8045766.1 transposase [Microcystis sp. LE19-41.2A]